MTVLMIGICGGTGAGKTTIATRIVAALPNDNSILLQQDHYYKDLGSLALEERARQNFDHPCSLDMDLLLDHVRRLKAGHEIDRPVYDFRHHVREQEIVRLSPRPTVVVEGTLIFENQALCELMDIKFFVDADADVRFIRRLRRDIRERGRTAEAVIEQYLATVRPMHMQFIEPYRDRADIIIQGTSNDESIDRLIRQLCSPVPLADASITSQDSTFIRTHALASRA